VSAVLLLVVATAGVYLFSLGPVPATVRGRAIRRWRAAAFFSALAVCIIALTGPIEQLAGRFQWAHMAQHLLLIVVVAPLLALADPWLAPLHLLPRHRRGPLGRTLFRDPRTARTRAWLAFLTAPLMAWILFHVTFLSFHVPLLYDLTLRSRAIHELEHVLFLVLAVLFWMPVVRRRPLATRDRLVYLMGAGFVGSALGLWLALAPVALYEGFAGSGSLSALADQRIAAGLMGGPGSVAIALAAGMVVYRWLGEEERGDLPWSSEGRRA
jgi:putative membrane protein